jgi:hypothetical protein
MYRIRDIARAFCSNRRGQEQHTEASLVAVLVPYLASVRFDVSNSEPLGRYMDSPDCMLWRFVTPHPAIHVTSSARIAVPVPELREAWQ